MMASMFSSFKTKRLFGGGIKNIYILDNHRLITLKSVFTSGIRLKPV